MIPSVSVWFYTIASNAVIQAHAVMVGLDLYILDWDKVQDIGEGLIDSAIGELASIEFRGRQCHALPMWEGGDEQFHGSMSLKKYNQLTKGDR